MARLRDNIAANYAGQAWTALMGIVFVPVYLRLLGAEGFGIVGLLLGLQSLSLALDLGASMFASREVARRRHAPADATSLPTLVRSIEAFAWPMAMLIGAGLWLAAPSAAGWLDAATLGEVKLLSALHWIAAVVAAQWPGSFYSAVLQGLERQRLLNTLLAAFATLRFAGVVPVLVATDGDVTAFLAWNLAVATAQTAALAMAAWRGVRKYSAAPARVAVAEFAGARGFAIGSFATVGLSLLLTQVDRFALSALRPLAEFGHYAVLLTLTAGLGRLMQPLFWAIYPRLSRMTAADDVVGASRLYHLATQCLAVPAAASGAAVAVYSEGLLAWWTGDSTMASAAAPAFALLVAGTALNGLLLVPYALQMANGLTRLTAWANLVALCLGLPYCIAATEVQGMTGAASLWLLVNAAFLAVVVPLAHRKVLPGESTRWYLRDVLPPVAAAVATAAAIAWVLPTLAPGWAGPVVFAGAWLACAGAALAAAPLARTQFIALFVRQSPRNSAP